MSSISEWAHRCLDAFRDQLAGPATVPGATYRLQFRHDQFRFTDAARLVPYLARLGITHVYASPYLKSRPGSEHGYDVVDHGRINDELGTEGEFRAFVAALDDHGMGHILDIVPNHMGVASHENHWWADVLENGPGSPHARYFDIDWEPLKGELTNRILLPVLGDQYGRALESGQLRLSFEGGSFRLHYYSTEFPIEPRSYAQILSPNFDQLKAALGADSEPVLELESILTAIDYLPATSDTDPVRIAERQREKEIIKHRLQRLAEDHPAVAEFIQRNLAELNGDPAHPQSFDALDRLLDAQVYRPSHWKAASDEINYRRFFDINELAAVCMEEADVFQDAHRFVFDLLVTRQLDGLRIDHIDGLYDPTTYVWRLQWGYLAALGRRSFESLVAAEPVIATEAAPRADANDLTGTSSNGTLPPGIPSWQEIEPAFLARLWEEWGGRHPAAVFAAGSQIGDEAAERTAAAERDDWPRMRLPLFVVVEKILEHNERLPNEWPVSGTTGYDFLNLVGGLFVDEGGFQHLSRYYTRFTNQREALPEIVNESKRLILRVAMSSELQLLASRLNRLSEAHRLSRDFTLNNLRTALREILACFPVYRTYITHPPVSERDRKFVQYAVAQAKRRNPAIDSAVFDFVRDTLLLEQPPGLDDEGQRLRRLFVGRFQQASSAVMAKGVEDTAFYRYFPLSSLNEVGRAIELASVSVPDFHRDNERRLRERPLSLLCTTTHDTKRSEDVRARIHVLSEIPHQWRAAISRWARLNRRHRYEVDGRPAPSRNDEYLFYQSLVGVWPLLPPRPDEHAELVSRLQRYMEKATHEAKLHTSWVNPNPGYDEAVRRFVEFALDASPENRFPADFRQFHDQIVDAGLYTALAQLLLKLTAPGVPDLYQGQELWDFSLVDPDNRRPVDYARRQRLLAELESVVAQGTASLHALAERLGRSPRDERLKLFVTWRVLQFRRKHQALFQDGDYVALQSIGTQAQHVCAFARQANGEVAIIVVPRLLSSLCAPAGQPEESRRAPCGHDCWQDTEILEERLGHVELHNVFTGDRVTLTQGRVRMADVLRQFPVALLSGSVSESRSASAHR
jgi:(1->4)-alpha-D-glucan 1-alpha-D-glucosylmutase